MSRDNYQFIPDTELTEFAGWFSDHFKILTEGVYYSENVKYKLWYGDIERSNTVTRIHSETHEVGVARNRIAEDPLYTREFIFFSILWCFCLIDLVNTEGEIVPPPMYVIDGTSKIQESKEARVDRYMLDWYLSTDRSWRLLYVGIKHQFEAAASELNVARFGEFKNRLEKLS